MEKKSQIINQKIIELPAFQNADTIFVYMDCKGEVSVNTDVGSSWAMGKKTAAPKVTGPGAMKYYYITSYDDLDTWILRYSRTGYRDRSNGRRCIPDCTRCGI